MSFTKLIVALGFCALLLSGSSKKSTAAAVNSKHVRIGYIGLTCEAPIFTAYEKGFFKEEGLEPELVKCNWATYKDALALGSYDITHHLVMYFLKPIEQGLDVRFLGNPPRLSARAGGRENEYSYDSGSKRQAHRSSRDGHAAICLRKPRIWHPRH